MKKLYKIFFGVLVVVFLVLQLFNIYLSDSTALEGIGASKIRIEISKLKEENTVLSSEILSHTSFDSISSRAGEMGFKEEKDFVSLYAPVQVAVGR